MEKNNKQSSKTKPALPNIYGYIDYRQYLVDLFVALNNHDESFSFRSFARLAQSTSPNYLQLIRDRKLNINDASLSSLVKGVGLKKKEKDYLTILVGFDQAKNHDEKDSYFKEILKKREYKSIKKLTKEQYQFFSHWYIPVIREFVVHPDYQDNPEWIVKKINPPITESKVRKGISVLKKLGLIRRSPQTNKWEMVNKAISTPSEVISFAVLKYHKDVIALASESIERFERSERDIRSVTVGLSEEGFKEVKMRFEAFWKEMMDYAKDQKDIRRVHQINMQFFPLSNKDKNK